MLTTKIMMTSTDKGVEETMNTFRKNTNEGGNPVNVSIAIHGTLPSSPMLNLMYTNSM